MYFGGIFFKYLSLIFFPIMLISKSWPIMSKLLEIEKPTYRFLKSIIFWNYGLQFPVGMWGGLRGSREKLMRYQSLTYLLSLTHFSIHCPRFRCNRQWVDQIVLGILTVPFSPLPPFWVSVFLLNSSLTRLYSNLLTIAFTKAHSCLPNCLFQVYLLLRVFQISHWLNFILFLFG